MLKLLIVDDEILVRVGIKTTVDWSSLDIQIVGEADNGEKALEIARNTRPDIVLTDIRMPKMDGITFIKALRVEVPDAKVVVLSCYDDMNSVRDAMQFGGALDYIPKLSLQSEDLYNCMNRVKELIKREKYNQNKIKEVPTHESTFTKNGFFNKIVKGGKISSKWFFDNINHLNLNLSCEDSYVVLCVLIDQYKIVENRDEDEDIKQFNHFFINITNEMISNKGIQGETFYQKDGQFVMLTSFHRDLNEESLVRKIRELCIEFLDKYKLYFNISASFGISNMISSINEFKSAYESAVLLANHRLYSGTKSINFSKNVPAYCYINFYTIEKEKLIKEALESGKEEDVKSVILEVFDRIFTKGNIPPINVFDECIEMLCTFSSVIKQYNGDIFTIKDEYGNEPYKSIHYCNTLKEIKDWFEIFIHKYLDTMEKLKKDMYGNEINKAIEYISMHYREEIALVDMASYVSMNETYLSHLFKKEVGYNFTDFLNIYRVNKAKEYLKMKNTSVCEVAEAVGYSSESYFSKVFKKITKISPNEYKKQKTI